MTISILSTLISSTKYNLSFPTKSYRNIGYIFVFQYFRLEFGYVLDNASAIGILYNYKNSDLIKVLNKTILTFDHCLVMIVDSMRTIKFRHRDQSPHNSGNLYWNILAVSSHHLEIQNLVKLSSAQQLMVTAILMPYLGAVLPCNINVDFYRDIFTALYWQVDTLFLVYYLGDISTFSPSMGRVKNETI